MSGTARPLTSDEFVAADLAGSLERMILDLWWLCSHKSKITGTDRGRRFGDEIARNP